MWPHVVVSIAPILDSLSRISVTCSVVYISVGLPEEYLLHQCDSCTQYRIGAFVKKLDDESSFRIGIGAFILSFRFWEESS